MFKGTFSHDVANIICTFTLGYNTFALYPTPSYKDALKSSFFFPLFFLDATQLFSKGIPAIVNTKL